MKDRIHTPRQRSRGVAPIDSLRPAQRPPSMSQRQAGVVALQRAVGNQAAGVLLSRGDGHRTVAGPLIQRDITVEQVDFDPRFEKYRDGYILVPGFTEKLRKLKSEIATKGRTDPNQPFLNQFDNVVAPVIEKAKGTGYTGPDVVTIARAIVKEIEAGYNDRGLTAFGPLRPQFERFVAQALGENIIRDPSNSMNEDEGRAYDELRDIVGAQSVSRSKGTATPLPYSRLPQRVKDGVDFVLSQMRAENNLWQSANLNGTLLQYLAPGAIVQAVSKRQRAQRYQGNHTNSAGWLPPSPAPATTPLRTLLFTTIRNAASVRLKATLGVTNWFGVLQLDQAAPANANPVRAEFFARLGAALPGFSDAHLHQTVWRELGMGVSGFVEFSLPTHISRLVYDVVNSRLYVSAHYKWREGYNPWFELTEVPNRPV